MTAIVAVIISALHVFGVKILAGIVVELGGVQIPGEAVLNVGEGIIVDTSVIVGNAIKVENSGAVMLGNTGSATKTMPL